jgi:ribosomal protein S18 acetylase RimI-like enzyme
MAQVEIRELRPATDESHLEQLLEAYLEIFNHPDNLAFLSLTMIPFEEDRTRRWLARSQDEGRRYFAVVGEGDSILAISVIKADPLVGFEISKLAVKPEVKYQGFGRLLIDCALTTAASEGYQAVDAQVFADNDATFRLTVGSGFTPVRMTHHLRADGGDIVHLRNYLNREKES